MISVEKAVLKHPAGGAQVERENGAAPIFIATHQLFSSRYLLGSEIFKYLKSRKVPLVIVTPNAENRAFRELFEDENVRIEKFDYDGLARICKSRLYHFFVKVRWLTLPHGLNIDTIRLHEAEERLRKQNMPFLKACYTELVIQTARLMRRSAVLRSLLVRLERTLFKSDAHRDLFERYRPKLLVIADIGTIELSNFLIDEAQRHGTEVLSIVLSWDNLTSKGIGAVKPDWAITWNQNMKDELVRYHRMPAGRIQVCGIAHFDDYFREPKWESRGAFLRKYHLSAERKTIFYGTNTPGLFRHNKKLIEFLLTAIEEGRLEAPCQLLVRLHPAFFAKHKSHYERSWQEFSRLQERFGELLSISRPLTIDQDYGAIQPIEDQMNLAGILANSDVMVNIFSTLMLEACIFDLPVINVGFYQFAATHFDNSILRTLTHIKRIVDYGAVRIANDEEELLYLINMYLRDRTIDHHQRSRVREFEAGPNKGSAGEAIGRHIERINSGLPDDPHFSLAMNNRINGRKHSLQSCPSAEDFSQKLSQS